ncbi:Hint domain-containing protein [Nereida sp. MMG025]|uniref:Hint domain-containing protein n=1 Tax=Nereida sp. MMG025 TaxID=2909981 RepID=UPI001F468EFB|nr:Hint domain-containing protein [Nereida sp. MMG025]MCF6445320.1 Hint domain-containing protein [Nereida sp. MMG025]
MSATQKSYSVHRATDLRVSHGVNLGDPISFADELIMEDVFSLSPMAAPTVLALNVVTDDGVSKYTIAEDSTLGTHGAQVVLDSTLTFMCADGTTIEAVIMVELIDGGVEDVFVLPMSRIISKQDYTLVGIDRDTPESRLAQLGSIAFLRGTHITLATGEQRRIEDLKVGDRILTRDAGAQELRWIGAATARATGTLAPIRIKAGVLNNINDLRVTPDHRLFVYQRRDTLKAGRAEVLVRARYLINGDSVIQEEGGFVDYFQLLFDRHQIIFAEGIAAESLHLDEKVKGTLPEEVAQSMSMDDHTASARAHLSFEISEGMLTGNTVDLLKRASRS